MDLTGKTLGKYQVQEKLGQGGMGAVYKAYDPDLDRTAAVKILPPGLATDPHFLERFRLEARAVARLDHPNIAAVFAAGEENGVYYLVMEYIQGGSLADLVRRESPVPVERTLELLEQAARALDYAHARGIVHRDIKPNNILIDGEGCAQLVDFGLVKVSEVSLTVAGQIFGTPAYMAPEQIEGNEVGPPADIYALGVVAYEMLAGKVPFQGPMATVFDGHTRRPPPPPRQFNAAIPPAMEAVILRALAKAPAERYSSAGAFVAALREASRAPQPAADDAVTIVEMPTPATDRPQPAGAHVEEAATGQVGSATTGTAFDPSERTVIESATPGTADKTVIESGALPAGARTRAGPGSAAVAAEQKAQQERAVAQAPPDRPRRGLGRLWPVLLGVAVVAVGGAIAFGAFANRDGPATPTPGPTEVVVVVPTEGSDPTAVPATVVPATPTEEAPTATSEPVASPSPTVEETPTPTETSAAGPTRTPAPARVTNVLAESFDDADDGRWELYDNPADRAVIEDGALHVTAIDPGIVTWSQYLTHAFESFRLEVDATAVGGPENNEYGVVVRQQDGDNLYIFTISSDGFYRIRKLTAGEWTDLQAWTPVETITQGLAQSNRLGVLAVGDRFEFSVNGELLTTVSDPDITSGTVGMAVATAEDSGEPVEVTFDNVTLAPALTDTFEEAIAGGWGLGDEEDARRAITNGELRILIRAENLVSWSRYEHPLSRDNFTLEVDATAIRGPENNEYGVIVHYQDAGNFYLFVISSDGFYQVRKLRRDQWTTIQEWDESPAIVQGVGETNRIRLVARGPEYQFYANGELLTTVTDEDLEGGRFALEAGTFDEGGVEIAFDNFAIIPDPE